MSPGWLCYIRSLSLLLTHRYGEFTLPPSLIPRTRLLRTLANMAHILASLTVLVNFHRALHRCVYNMSMRHNF